MERVATTTSSLEAEKYSGNINRTQSMAILNESLPLGTDSGGGPRCQVTILGVQRLNLGLRLHLNSHNDPPLSRVNTLGSGEDINTGDSRLMLSVLVNAARHKLTTVELLLLD
ncbi:hypothetical protein Tco_1131157 [Tanacetum coccineum]